MGAEKSFSSLGGYEVKDAKARQDIEELFTGHEYNYNQINTVKSNVSKNANDIADLQDENTANATAIALLKDRLTVKSITFTDRPSLYAWLQNNLDKVVKASMNTNQFPAPVNFTQVIAEFNEDTNTVNYVFQQFHGWISSQVEVEVNTFLITGTSTEQRFGQVRGESYTKNIIPDEYWTPISVIVEIYYIE